VDLLLESKNQY